MSVPLVGVSVLNWNRAAVTRECLRSLRAINYPNLTVVLVDNGSTEEESLQLGTECDEFITSHTNLGFSEGMNLGIKHLLAKSVDIIVCANNDIVVDKHYLSGIVDLLTSEPRAGAVTPLVLQRSHPGQIMSLGRRVNLMTGLQYFQFAKSLSSDAPETPFETDALDGCCMAFRASVLAETGLLSPSYHGTEDTEISLRIRRAGYGVFVAPSSVVWHVGGLSKGGRMSRLDSYFLGRNFPRLTREYGSFAERALFWPLFVTVHAPLWLLTWMATGRVENIHSFIQGTLDGFNINTESRWREFIE